MIDGVVDSEEDAAEYVGRKVVKNERYLSCEMYVEAYPDKNTENRSNGNTKRGNNE